MLDVIAKESIVPVVKAHKFIPGRPSTSTVWRWTTKGVGGIKLDSLKIGGKRVTSHEAIQRFLAACNAEPPTHAEAEAELSDAGIQATPPKQTPGCEPGECVVPGRTPMHSHDTTIAKDSPRKPATPKKPKKQPAADAIVVIADMICHDNHFSQDAGNRLYRYCNGTYKQRVEEYVKRCVKAATQAKGNVALKWTKHLADSVVEYVRVDCPTLWESPPLDVINLKNGLLRLKDRTLLPHSPEHLSHPPMICWPIWLELVANNSSDRGKSGKGARCRAPSPHHLACGSALGGSAKRSKLAPELLQ